MSQPMPSSMNPNTITYEGKSIYAWPLLKRGRKAFLYMDNEGFLYEAAWERAIRGFTPNQRRNARFTRGDIKYVRYTDIFSYHRKLKHALIDGDKRMPHYDELKAWAEEINGTFASLAPGEIDEITRSQLESRIQAVIDGTARAVDTGIQEAQQQMQYVVMFVDSRGRFNKGVLRCHTSAAHARLQERMENIQIWKNEYAQRMLVTEKFINTFFQAVWWLIFRLKDHIFDFKSKHENRWVNLQEKIPEYRRFFAQWDKLHPFANWVKHTQKDLQTLSSAVGRKDTAKVTQLLPKLLAAANMKLASQDIFEAILVLGDCESPSDGAWIYPAHIQKEARRLLFETKKTIHTIDDGNFTFRVKEKVETDLMRAIKMLDKPFQREESPREFLKNTVKLL